MLRTAVEGHVLPFGLVVGNRARFRGPNLVGLRRHKLALGTINLLKTIFYQLYDSGCNNHMHKATMKDRARAILLREGDNKHVQAVCEFVLQNVGDEYT